MKIFKFSTEETHNVPLGEILGSAIGKLFGEVDCNPLIAFSDEIAEPKVLTDFLRSYNYCIDTTFFNISEGSGMTLMTAHSDEISALEANVVLICLNTDHTAEELYNAADNALKVRKNDIIAIALSKNGVEIAVGNDKDHNNTIQVLLAFCDSIGEIITDELLARFT